MAWTMMKTSLMNNNDGMKLFDQLCDNTFAYFLLFLDFESAVRFSRLTCSALHQQCSRAAATENSALHHAWRNVFARHHFAPDHSSQENQKSAQETVVEECQLRRCLVKTLVGRRKQHNKSKLRNVFNLPNKHFFFVPVTPEEDEDDDLQWDDPPPVDFDCDSFLLTSSGRSGEMVFLDPFSRALTLHEHCTDNAVASDEAMMEQAMLDAASVIRRRTSLGLPHEVPDEDIAGAIFDESVYKNHNMEHYRVEPSQVLLDESDYFDVDLSQYFKFTNLRNGRRRDGNVPVIHEEDEVEVGYLGIDRKYSLGDKNEMLSTMLAVARNFWSDPENGSEALGVTEVLTWTRLKDEASFGHRRVCRFPWDFMTLEICVKHNRLYVSFLPEQGPVSHDTVIVYPLVQFDDENDRDDDQPDNKYFPEPLFNMKCSHGVSLVTADATGNTILIGTTQGTVEMWKADDQSVPHRVGILNMKASAIESAKRFRAHNSGLEKQTSPPRRHSIESSTATCSAEAPPAMAPIESDTSDSDQLMESSDDSDAHHQDGSDVWLPRFHSSNRVQAILYPAHLPFETCGFVTLMHTRGEGDTLLLWKKPSPDVLFEVVSQINLPLSSQRKPLVHYDGRRIIVFGQDHIGMIILVYQVLSSNEDICYFQLDSKCNGDQSGGLYNFTSPPRVRFANRIRHAGLGGLEYYDSIHMTCNERFLIVNTKTGNLLGGGSTPTGDGMLVIDLLDQK